MTAANLINSMVPPLKPQDTVQEALELLDEFQLDHLPVVEGDMYLGMAAREQLELLDAGLNLSGINLESELASVDEGLHLLEIIKIMSENETGIVAVIDHERHYQGVVAERDIVQAIAHTHTVQGEGAVLVLELYMRDLHLGEITRILEAENVKITGLFTAVHEEDPAKIYLTLKLNKRDSSHAVATLERFEYQIVAEHNLQRNHDIDAARMGNLMRYLNV